MFMATSRATGFLVVVAILLTASCSDATTGPASHQQSESIGIAVSSAQLDIVCGIPGTVTATLARGGGFEGAVNLSVSGLPPGVTAFLSPSVLAGANTTATISVLADETAPQGSYAITVKAVSSIGEATTAYILAVVYAPHFHLTVEPSVLPVETGKSGAATVHIDRRDGFSGSVELSAAVPRSELDVAFDPAVVMGTTSIVTVSVAATLPVGNYPVTLTGTAAAIPNGTTTVGLQVNTLPAGWYVTADPAELTVVRGSSGQTEVSIFPPYNLGAGWATYSLVNPPPGIAAGFEFWFDGGYPATATITVAQSVAPGDYTLTLAAAFQGYETRTTTIRLTVRDP